jgi:beta-glucosidase
MSESTMDRAAPFGALETPEQLTAEQIEAKAQALLAQLTLDEKIKMMSGDVPFWPGMVDMNSGGYNKRAWPAGTVPRLGIPGVRFSDGPRGVVMKGATTFPVSMARGATWDTDLEERIGDVIGREMRAMGANFFGGVCINLLRHPAWGRAQETYGEDSYQLGEFGAALASGVQHHVMACAKHYALNSMENARFSINATVELRALHEVYLPHFKRTIDAGVASVMSAYNSVNGEWCGQNSQLLNDILKEEWGFTGFVMTDFILGMRDSKKAALAGQDVEMPFAMLHNRDLKALVLAGEVPQSRIDDAALRVLRQQIRFAAGRNPGDYQPEIVGCEAHRALAREAACKSIVLLKNEGGMLPLKNIKQLAVIGKLAATPNTGDGGSSNTQPAYVITPLQGLEEALGPSVKLQYDDGSDPARAAQLAMDADAVLLVVGYTSKDEGEYIGADMMSVLEQTRPTPKPEELIYTQKLAEIGANQGSSEGFAEGGDRAALTLNPNDETLIQAVAAANPHVVVTVMAGSAVIMEAWRDRVSAILMLWYPGMEGGRALADVLLGNANPSGHLPCTFPARMEDLPFFDRKATQITYDLWHGYRKLERDGAKPAFPFGFGLSYTTFSFSNLRLDQNTITPNGTLTATLDVTNTGAAAGEPVVQCYIAVPGSSVERAPKELKAFVRLSLQPGECKAVQIQLPSNRLAYYDVQYGWTVEKTAYSLIVGQHSGDEQALQASFEVK